MIKVNWREKSSIDQKLRGSGISDTTQLTVMVKMADATYSSIKSPYSELWSLLFRLEESKNPIDSVYVYHKKTPLLKVLKPVSINKSKVASSVNEYNISIFKNMSVNEKEMWSDILSIQIQNAK